MFKAISCKPFLVFFSNIALLCNSNAFSGGGLRALTSSAFKGSKGWVQKTKIEQTWMR